MMMMMIVEIKNLKKRKCNRVTSKRVIFLTIDFFNFVFTSEKMLNVCNFYKAMTIKSLTVNLKNICKTFNFCF